MEHTYQRAGALSDTLLSIAAQLPVDIEVLATAFAIAAGRIAERAAMSPQKASAIVESAHRHSRELDANEKKGRN